MAVPNPTLMIMFSSGKWQAAVSNGTNVYYFNGATPDEQVIQVEELRTAMSSGNASVVTDSLPEIFSNVTAQNQADVFEELFIETEDFMYLGELLERASGASLAIDLAEIAAEWVI